MWTQVEIPGWGMTCLQICPPVVADADLRRIPPKDVRMELASLYAAKLAQQDPLYRKVMALLEHATDKISEIGRRGDVARLRPHEIDKETQHWRVIEEQCRVVLQELKAKSQPSRQEIHELARRWLVVQQEAVPGYAQAHAIDGHRVVAGVIQPKLR